MAKSGELGPEFENANAQIQTSFCSQTAENTSHSAIFFRKVIIKS